MKPSISLIISFYNNIELLKFIFAALEKQTFSDFEVIISDDGSRPNIVEEVQLVIKKATFSVKHCWHPDSGWRKNSILNKSIQAAEGDYLLFIDGDCIPHHRFIEEHYQNRNKGKVLTGRRVQLTEKLTENLTIQQIESGYLEKCGLLKLFWAGFFQEVKHVENGFRIRNKIWRNLFVKDKVRGILGCNFSMFKSDILIVNGFDERFLHPGTGEDTDLDSRLKRAGITTISKKHLLTIYHIYHKKFDLAYQPNIDLWEENNANQVIFTPFGITK